MPRITKPLTDGADKAAAAVRARAASLSEQTGVGAKVEGLGDYLRQQRTNAELSLRQLSELAGVSNPYLSQIERGVRKPSAEVLQQIAKALRISAEQLYVRAGIWDPDDSRDRSVPLAVMADQELTERQRRVLLDIYESFRNENSRP